MKAPITTLNPPRYTFDSIEYYQLLKKSLPIQQVIKCSLQILTYISLTVSEAGTLTLGAIRRLIKTLQSLSHWRGLSGHTERTCSSAQSPEVPLEPLPDPRGKMPHSTLAAFSPLRPDAAGQGHGCTNKDKTVSRAGWGHLLHSCRQLD